MWKYSATFSRAPKDVNAIVVFVKNRGLETPLIDLVLYIIRVLPMHIAVIWFGELRMDSFDDRIMRVARRRKSLY